MLSNFEQFDEQSNKQKEKSESSDVCAICLESHNVTTFETGQIIETKCNHIYHKNCIKKVLTIMKTCPLCNGGVWLYHVYFLYYKKQRW